MSASSKTSMESISSFQPTQLYSNLCDAILKAMAAPKQQESLLDASTVSTIKSMFYRRRYRSPTTTTMRSLSPEELSQPKPPPSPRPAPPPPRVVFESASSSLPVNPRAAENGGMPSSNPPSIASLGLDTLSMWTERSAEYGLCITTDPHQVEDGVFFQHMPDLIQVPTTRIPVLYQQLCRAVWNAVQNPEPRTTDPCLCEKKSGEEPVSSVYARSPRMYRRDGSDLYNSICDGLWDVLSMGSEPPSLASMVRRMENEVMMPVRPEPVVSGQHLPNLVAFPCQSMTSVFSNICDGVWEVVSALSDEHEARVRQFDSIGPKGEHLPPLISGPPDTARTAAPHQNQAPRGCYHLHPVVPKPVHSILGKKKSHLHASAVVASALAGKGGLNSLRMPPLEDQWKSIRVVRQTKEDTFTSRDTTCSSLPAAVPPLALEAPLPTASKTSSNERLPSLSGARESSSALAGFNEYTPSMETISSTSFESYGPGSVLPYFYRDECVRRERIFWAMVMESLRRFPWPMNPMRRAQMLHDLETAPTPELEMEWLQHPALVMGLEHTRGVEDYDRRCIELEESEALRLIMKEYTYEHRLVTVGTLPVEKFLRWWIYQFRGRRLRHAKQRELLFEREAAARLDLIQSDPSMLKRNKLMHDAVLFLEKMYRIQLELLQLRTFYVMGSVSIRLSEQVSRFPLLFGGSMRKTRACARVSGTTVFMGVHLMETLFRSLLQEEERFERTMVLPYEAERFSLVNIFEPPARLRIEEEQEISRAEMEYRIHQLIVYYTNRDVEIYRSATLDVELRRPFEALGIELPDPFF